MSIVMALPVNPEPWKVGPVSIGHKGRASFPVVAPDPQLSAYQEAIREAAIDWLAECTWTPEIVCGLNFNKITFWFWRQLASYKGANRQVTKHKVDATNLQKGTEDALQKILYNNDVTNIAVTSYMVRQDKDLDHGMVLIELDWITEEKIHDTISLAGKLEFADARQKLASRKAKSETDPTQLGEVF